MSWRLCVFMSVLAVLVVEGMTLVLTFKLLSDIRNDTNSDPLTQR